jgi:hypothetical protein
VKISVRNLGIIAGDEAKEINIKPLTVLVGPNNAGKTWLAYAIYGILGKYGWRRYAHAYIAGEVTTKYPILEEVVQNIFDKGNDKLDLKGFVTEQGENYFNHVALYAPNWLQDFFATERIQFDDFEARIELGETQKRLLERIEIATVDEKISAGHETSTPLLSALKDRGDHKLYFYTGGNIAEELPVRVVREFVVSIVFRLMHRSLYQNAYPFPTERTAYITIPFSIVDSDRDTINFDDEKESVVQGRQLQAPPIPIMDFIGMTVRLFFLGRNRNKEARKNKAIRQYIRFERFLQEHILNGNVDFSTPDLQPGRELLFRASNTANNSAATVEIPIASSMVKELAPLVLYLRYLAEPGELLVIDEPEMNLHPEAQAKIIEFLAMLVNAGLHVLVTTHSTYVVDHLMNLMQAQKREDQDEIAEMFFLKQKDAFIAQENVSVNLVDGGTIKNILDEDGSIDWETFSDVTEHVTRIHFAL